MNLLIKKTKDIVDKLSKKHKIDFKYFLSGGFWLLVSQVVNTICSLTLAIFLGFFIPKETFGEYRYLLSFFAILSVFYLSGYQNTLIQYTSKGETGIFYKVFKIVLFSSFSATIISLAISGYYVYNQNNTLAIGLLLIGVSIPFLNSFQLYSSYLNGKKDFKRTALYGFIPDIFSVLFIVPFAYYIGSSIFILFSYLISNIILHLIVLNLVLKIYPPKKDFSSAIGSSPIHISIMSFVSVLTANIDKFLLFSFIGSTQLAVFFFAQTIPLQVRGMTKIVSTLLLPKFTNQEKINKEIFSKMLLLTLVTLVGIVIFIIIAPLIFKVFFPKYTESTIYAQIYSISILFYPSAYVMSTYFYAKNKIKELNIITYLNSTIIISSNLYFIYYHGILGATISAIICSASLFLIHLYLFIKIIKQKPTDL